MNAGVRHYDETIESVMFVVVLVNSVTILAEVLYAESLRGEEARGAREVVQAVEFCFTLLYCVEMAVKMQVLGAARYCTLTPPSRAPRQNVDADGCRLIYFPVREQERGY